MSALHQTEAILWLGQDIEEGGSLTIIATALTETGSAWTT